MHTTLQCAACFIDDLRGALEDLVEDPGEQFAILAEAMHWLSDEFRPSPIPSYFITRLHRLLKAHIGQETPFAELRARCNEAGGILAARLAARLADISGDHARLRFLCQWAIAGNHLDFRTVGTGYTLSPDGIEALLAEAVEEGLSIDHTGALLEMSRRQPRVLYLCDNVGEIAIDRLLIKELQRHGCAVTAAVKGGPITSDAVLADAQAVGLTELVPLVLTGPDTLGLPLDEMSAQMEADLQAAELIISKGQANYYALSEIYRDLPGNVFCLLRTKCQSAAASLGHPDRKRINVAVWLNRHL